MHSIAYQCTHASTCIQAKAGPLYPHDSKQHLDLLVLGTHSGGGWVSDVYGPAGEAAVYWRPSTTRQAAPAIVLPVDDVGRNSRGPDYRAARRAAAMVRRLCREHHLHRVYTLTYAVGTTDWHQGHRDMAGAMKALRISAFGGVRFPYCWVFGLHANGNLHVHLALGLDIGQVVIDECWGRGRADATVPLRTDPATVGAYLATNVRAAEAGSNRPAGSHRYGRARGYGVTRTRSLSETRAEAVALCVRAMGGEVPSYWWDSPDRWDGPPVTFLSWPSSTIPSSPKHRHVDRTFGGGDGLAVFDPDIRGPSFAIAQHWLAHALAAGPTDSTELKRAARTAGISERTLQRARHAMDIRVLPAGYPRTTQWLLPAPMVLPSAVTEP